VGEKSPAIGIALDENPPFQTCHRHFQQWVKLEDFKSIAEELAQDQCERTGETFVKRLFTEPLCRQKRGSYCQCRQDKRG
jgi:hypothetical protein